MRCEEVVIVWDKNINSWISEVKQYQESMENEQSKKVRKEYQINEIMHAKGAVGYYNKAV